GLVAEQPLLAHEGQRRLVRVAADDGEDGGDECPPKHRLEDLPAGTMGKREAFDARGHESLLLTSTSVPAKTCVLYSDFCRSRAAARRGQHKKGRPGSSVGRAHD